MYAVDFLESRRVGYERLLHGPATGGTRRARSTHMPGRCVAKTVLVHADGAFVLALLPATSRIDLDLLAAALRSSPMTTRLATTDEIDAIFVDCEPGVIPPFGRLYGLHSIVDSRLCEAEEVVFPANTRHLDLKIPFEVYEALEEPLRATFGRPIEPGATHPAPRRRRRAS
jgi:Ala-tRNA(Pro) deacylase